MLSDFLNVASIAPSSSVITPSSSAVSKEFRNKLINSKNPYGDGKSSKRILDTIINTKINDKLLIKGICT